MSTPAPTTTETYRPTENSDPATLLTGDGRADGAWVGRCQRQFDQRRRRRLRNLVDHRSQAMPDPDEPLEI